MVGGSLLIEKLAIIKKRDKYFIYNLERGPGVYNICTLLMILSK